MIKHHTLAFAARHLADTVANSGQAGLLKALSGHEGFDPIPVIREQLEFQARAVGSDDGAVYLAALNYALGRMSASVWIVSEDIRDNWDSFSEETKSEIKSRITKALDSDRAGTEMDRRQWATILDIDAAAAMQP